MLPKKDNFDYRYDSVSTLQELINFNNTIGMNKMLEKAAKKELEENQSKPEINENISQYKKISKDDVMIAFEHYKTNYMEIDKERPLYEGDDDIGDDDDEEENDFSPIDMMPAGILRFGQEKPIHYTPWGKFDTDNPLSPVHLYDLRAVHFKGFTTKSIPNFSSLMNTIEGVSIWAQIDPYFIVIAPAKLYDFADVRANIEEAIYTALNIEVTADTSFDLDHYIMEVAEKSSTMFSEGTDNFALIFPDKDFSVEYIENPTQENIVEICSLFNQIKNLIVFKNGEVYEC